MPIQRGAVSYDQANDSIIDFHGTIQHTSLPSLNQAQLIVESCCAVGSKIQRSQERNPKISMGSYQADKPLRRTLVPDKEQQEPNILASPAVVPPFAFPVHSYERQKPATPSWGRAISIEKGSLPAQVDASDQESPSNRKSTLLSRFMLPERQGINIAGHKDLRLVVVAWTIVGRKVGAVLRSVIVCGAHGEAL